VSKQKLVECDEERAWETSHIHFLLYFTPAGDKDNGKLPKGFPGVLAVDINNKDYVHPDYRSSATKIPEEFVYFCDKLMPHVDTRRKSRFTMEERAEKPMRQIYSTSDEAFGLLVLHNELDAWDEMHKKRKENKSGRELRTSRKFCSCMDGKGFSNTGRLMFRVLEVQVGKLRNTKTSKKLEKSLREKFRGREGIGNRQQDKTVTRTEKQMIEWLKKNGGEEETSKSKNKQSENQLEGSGDESSVGDNTE